MEMVIHHHFAVLLGIAICMSGLSHGKNETVTNLPINTKRHLLTGFTPRSATINVEDLSSSPKLTPVWKDMFSRLDRTKYILKHLPRTDEKTFSRLLHPGDRVVPADLEDVIDQVLAVDKDNGNLIEAYLQEFSSTSLTKTDIELKKPDVMALFASLTPLLEVSQPCREESINFLFSLFQLQNWAIRMVDATGKLPDGMLSDMADACEIVKTYTSIDYCALMQIQGPVLIPYGNTFAMGSYEECLAISQGIDSATNKTAGVHGRYSSLSLVDANSEQVPSRSTMEIDFRKTVGNRIGIVTGIGDLVISGLPNIPNGLIGMFASIMNIRWGQCTPGACTVQDIEANYKELYKHLNLKVNVRTSTTEETRTPPLTNTAIAVISLLSIVGFLLLVGTILDACQNLYPKLDGSGVKGHSENGLVTILKCFSVYTNGTKLLNSSHAGEEHLGCLGGIRVISMLWVVLGHVFGFGMTLPLRNMASVMKNIGGEGGAGHEVIFNAFPAVDTFFFMSGLLVAYLSLAELQKKRFNIIVYYVHRYIRLTIPLIFAIAIVSGVAEYLWSGVHSAEYSGEGCRQYGWTNLLYINNFVKDGSQCLGATWYLANDMQLYWCAPFLILPFWWNKKVGLLLWALVMAVVTAVIVFLVLENDLPPMLTLWDPMNIINPPDFDFFFDFYVKPYIRAQPYLMGMLMGYLLYLTKGKEIKINHALNVVLWQCSVVTGLLVIYGTYALRSPVETLYTPFSSVMYNCLHRIAWSLALSWVVFSCVKGYGGIINSFLSWGAFLPLGRMSYWVYLLHLDFILMFYLSFDYTVEYDDFIMTIYFIGITSIAFGLAFIFSLAFEAPFLRLEKLVTNAIWKQNKLLPPLSEKPPTPAVFPQVQEETEDKKIPPSEDLTNVKFQIHSPKEENIVEEMMEVTRFSTILEKGGDDDGNGSTPTLNRQPTHQEPTNPDVGKVSSSGDQSQTLQRESDDTPTSAMTVTVEVHSSDSEREISAGSYDEVLENEEKDGNSMSKGD